MSEDRRPQWVSVLVYSLLRLVLLLAVWGLIAWLSPVKGLWALALALLVSGAISLFALNRQRDEMSVGVASFFGRINARIDAAARAEDPVPSQPGETGPDDDAVDEEQEPGRLQRGDE